MTTFSSNLPAEIDPTRLRALHGRVVLVQSSRDHRNPPAAMRGWIEVIEPASAAPEIRVAMEFPQMFASRAHHRSLRLDAAQLAELFASEKDGAFRLTIDEDLV